MAAVWKKVVVKFALANVLLALSAPVFAWGYFSHQVICDIAWRNLESRAKSEVRKLLKETDFKTFAKACTWPDAIRTMRRYADTKPHHYINVPRSATSIDVNRDCTEQGCVIEAIRAYRDILQGKAVDGYSNNRPKALMFLGHYIGDLHQPLHVAYEDDRGGTGLMLRYGSKEKSLHQFWDVTIPEFGLPNRWRTAGERLNKRIRKADIQKWQQGSVLAWGNESLQLTRRIYAEIPSNYVMQSFILKDYYPVAELKIQQAGIRLAHTLNDIFKR